jgi:hypothetical protein
MGRFAVAERAGYRAPATDAAAHRARDFGSNTSAGAVEKSPVAMRGICATSGKAAKVSA